MAVERPPIGKNPRNFEKGLEKVTSSGVICVGGGGVTQDELVSGTDAALEWDKHLTNNDISHVYHQGGRGVEGEGERGR